MIRVLHCIETIGYGGVEQRRLLLAKYLDRERYSQFMLCSNVKAQFDQKLAQHGMPVYAIGSLRHVLHLTYYIKLIQVVRKVKPYIIHGAVFEGVISAVVAGLICRVPVIIIEETSDPINRSKKATWLLKVLSWFADGVVAISPSVLNYLILTAGISKSKTRLINNAVEEPAYPSMEEVASIRKRFCINDSDFVVGSVGRMYDFVKRFSDLIKALPLLVKNIPQIKLLLVGGGKDLESLKQLAKSLSVEPYVVFTDFQVNTAPFYSMIDVFALVSDTEGFGLVVVEAMYFRLPVVVTAVGGMKDIVVDGKTGLHVSKHNPQAISEGIQKLYANSDLRKEMGLKGYERALNEYSAPVYVANVKQLYEEVVNSRLKIQ
jgi:glycosyltransferase involved in cell wall biosynthesis